MSTQDWRNPPRPRAQPQGRGTYPRVIDQRPEASGFMLVTFSLPGLRRMTVRVPAQVWLDGEHLRIGAAPHEWLDAL